MKKLIYTLMSLLVLCSSCEDWFDVEPRTEIKEDNLFQNENGYFDALVGVYTLMGKPNLYGDQLTMSLLDGIIQNYYVTNSSAHPLYYVAKRDYTNTNLRSTIDAIWSGLYNAIANTNNILEHLSNCNPSLFSGDNYNIIKGEALAQRAFLHFDLLRLFGPSFVMDRRRPCIPYVTTLSKENTKLSTPEEVVQLCLQDLTEADGLLEKDPISDKENNSENIYLMNRTCRLNSHAVKALMARIYHYAGDKENALKYAHELVENEELELTTNLTGIKADRIFSQEILFSLFVDNMSDWVDNHFGTAASGYDYLQYEPFLDELFEKNAGLGLDVRQTELFNNNNTICKLNKYLMNSTDAYSSKYRIPMLRLSEAYYIAAESTDDLEEAEKWLNDVRTARGLESKTFSSFNEIQTYLTNEYRREFWGEGQAFYRYKWLNADAFTGYYTTINLENIKEETYILPLPEQEEQYGGTSKK